LSIKILSREAVITGPKDSLWWRDVVGVGGKDEDCWFPSQVSSKVGNGKAISFWKEKWFGATPLRDLFPSLFAKELHKDCVVSDIIQLDNFELNWTRDWLTSLTHAESVEKAELEHLLFGLVLQSDIADRWRWNTDVTDILTALHKLWKNNVPSKVGVFGWRLLLDKLPTRANLASKGGGL
ncbi:cysteine-rich receptor-like protein kinase, partial [Trifolium pratense]